MQRPLLAALTFAAATTLGSAASYQLHSFTKTQLTDKFWAEGATAADVNRDGKMDAVYGPFWFAGPDYTKRHEYRPATATFKRKGADGAEQTIEGYEGGLGINNAYSDNFFSWAYDFNGDGWTDILLVGMPGDPAYWFENPQNRPGHWQRHTIFDTVDNESPVFLDITGDGKPEIVCNSKGFFGYAEPDWANPSRPWTFHPVTPNKEYHKYTHGIGVGDVNGDRRPDLLEKDGWWEHPASLAGDPVWTHHPFTFSPVTDKDVPVGGAQMYAYDVNHDGLNDVITCFASHGYWLVWWEQTRTGNEVSFRQHNIIGKKPADSRYGVVFSQPHAIELVDMNGDGLLDILTGKRFWAHGSQGDPAPNDPAVLYWFELVRNRDKSADYIPHLIDDNSGVGTQVTFADMNGDKRPDVVVGNKKGAFVFLQEARKVKKAAWEAAQPLPLPPAP